MDATAHTHSHRQDEAARLALTGFVVVGLFVGYEWFMSGLTKFVRGGFPSGLSAELTEKSEGVAGWYKSFLDSVVIPNGKLFGILIEAGELLIGIALIGSAIVLLLRWRQLSYRAEVAVLATVALASLGAIFLNVNLHLANGSAHPWLLPEDGFDEGVDLDSLLPLIQLGFLVVSVKLLVALRRERRADVAGSGDGTSPEAGSPAAHTVHLERMRREPVMKRPTVNIAPAERLGRVLVGAVGLIGGIVLLTSAASPAAVVLEGLLILAGLDLMVTGALGHCPLYRKLGHTPTSLRRTS